jgi:hypothetical protein
MKRNLPEVGPQPKVGPHRTVPANWRAEIAGFDPDRPPRDVPQKRWRQLLEDCARLSGEGIFDKAIQLGWTEIDLFGCDRDKPYARVDQMGLAWFPNGGRILAMTASVAVIRTGSGAQQTFRRKPSGPGQILVWELTDQEEQPEAR